MKNYINRNQISITILVIVFSITIFSCSNQTDSKEKIQIVGGKNIDNDRTKSEDKITGPTFPGGVTGLQKYLQDNIKYPEKAKKDSLQDKVLVKFIVSKDGKITDSEIMQGKYEELNNEALRLIKNMPDWVPSKQKDNQKMFEYVIPIVFKLDSKKIEK
jgi:TonB family protein